jgi:hypothetical protein
MCIHRMHLRPHIQSIDMIYIARVPIASAPPALLADWLICY